MWKGFSLCSVLLLAGYAPSGCVKSLLAKYRPSPNLAANQAVSMGAQPRLVSEGQSSSDKPPKLLVEKLERDTYVLSRPVSQVWQTAIKVLLSHYNINIADRSSGLMTTEWDSFYLGGELFRNKISLNIQANGKGSLVKIYNNVEYRSSTSVSGVWLPSTKGSKEVQRLVGELRRQLAHPRQAQGNSSSPVRF